MTSHLVLARHLVYNAIEAARPTMVYNQFDIEETYIPLMKIESPEARKGKVWIIGAGIDDKDRRTRYDPSGAVKPLVTREIMIHVSYQQTNILVDDMDTLNTLCLVLEQIRDAVKNYDYLDPATPSFNLAWIRNESLKDENGFPVHFYMLREGNIFESYFTAYFNVPHQ